LSHNPDLDTRVVSYGHARAKKGFMAMAVVPAAQMALEKAGITIEDVAVIKTHNPFAANDIFMADQMGINLFRHEQLWVITGLRPSPGPHSRAPDH
jgi:acetyl-CoA acetyltransferase